jgi:hypothetical protein
MFHRAGFPKCFSSTPRKTHILSPRITNSSILDNPSESKWQIVWYWLIGVVDSFWKVDWASAGSVIKWALRQHQPRNFLFEAWASTSVRWNHQNHHCNLWVYTCWSFINTNIKSNKTFRDVGALLEMISEIFWKTYRKLTREEPQQLRNVENDNISSQWLVIE